MFKCSTQYFIATSDLICDLLNHILITQVISTKKLAWVERSKIYQSIKTFAIIPLISIMYLKTSVYAMPNSLFLHSVWLAHLSSFFTSQRWSSFCSETADGEEEKSAAPIEEDRTEDQVRKKRTACRDCKKGGDWPRSLLVYWVESLSSSLWRNHSKSQTWPILPWNTSNIQYYDKKSWNPLPLSSVDILSLSLLSIFFSILPPSLLNFTLLLLPLPFAICCDTIFCASLALHRLGDEPV